MEEWLSPAYRRTGIESVVNITNEHCMHAARQKGEGIYASKTNNLEKRLLKHKNTHVSSTKSHRPIELWTTFNSENEAIKLKKSIRKVTREKKRKYNIRKGG